MFSKKRKKLIVRIDAQNYSVIFLETLINLHSQAICKWHKHMISCILRIVFQLQTNSLDWISDFFSFLSNRVSYSLHQKRITNNYFSLDLDKFLTTSLRASLIITYYYALSLCTRSNLQIKQPTYRSLLDRAHRSLSDLSINQIPWNYEKNYSKSDFIRSLGNNNWNKTGREWNDLKIFERYARNSVHEARFESRFAFAPVAEREEVGHNNIAALYNSNRMRSRNGRANEKLEKVITQRGVFAFCAHYSETPCGEIRSRSCVRARI